MMISSEVWPLHFVQRSILRDVSPHMSLGDDSSLALNVGIWIAHLVG